MYLNSMEEAIQPRRMMALKRQININEDFQFMI